MDVGKLNELSVRRVCRDCGAVFLADKEVTALQKFSDHITIHQATLAQWSTAYERIVAAKERKEPLRHEHSHKCRECGGVWKCNLNSGTAKSPKCHWDDNPDCVKCA